MSEVKWCDKGGHAFSLDDGMDSVVFTKRIAQDDGTVKVVQKQGDVCPRCSSGDFFKGSEQKTIAGVTETDSRGAE